MTLYAVILPEKTEEGAIPKEDFQTIYISGRDAELSNRFLDRIFSLMSVKYLNISGTYNYTLQNIYKICLVEL